MASLRLIVLSATLLAVSAAGAQTTYRWIDPASGLTVFSDQAPPAGARQVAKTTGDTAADQPQLPYATRQAQAKFPVSLYTTANCADACKDARRILKARGIPFAENVITSEDELAELGRKLGGEAAVPTLFVGQQSVRGLEDSAWNDLLDLAGYPRAAPSGAFAK